MFHFAVVKNDDGSIAVVANFHDKDRKVAIEKALKSAARLRANETDDLITYEIREAIGPGEWELLDESEEREESG